VKRRKQTVRNPPSRDKVTDSPARRTSSAATAEPATPAVAAEPPEI
jgi:hypothetical protein